MKAFDAMLLAGLLLGLAVGCMEWDDERDWREEWTDPETGLMWQVSTESDRNWESAMRYCDSSIYGGYKDWRLPTVSELRSLVRGCSSMESADSCRVTDSCVVSSCLNEDNCDGCPSHDGPADGCYWPAGLEGDCDFYWSSTVVTDEDNIWVVSFATAGVNINFESGGHSGVGYGTSVRCVR